MGRPNQYLYVGDKKYPKQLATNVTVEQFEEFVELCKWQEFDSFGAGLRWCIQAGIEKKRSITSA